MILQFLRENNMEKAFEALVDETGCLYPYVDNVEDLLTNVKKGHWH